MEHKTLCIPFSKTGTCKFGNTCKYSHIRLDTSKNTNICWACKNDAVNPMITNCNHTYCYECAIKNLDRCLKCNENLFGIFYFLK